MRYLALVIPFVAAIALAAAPAPAINQADAGDAPAFEVASVKANKSGAGSMFMGTLPTSFKATNVTVQALLMTAYRLRQYQIQGAPAWLNSDRFDIAAKPPEGTSPDQLMLMVRSLLADRFRLVVHNETKDAPIYALVLARSDGKLGPRLSKTTDDCQAILAERKAAARARGPGPVQFTPPSPTERAVCTSNMRSGPGQNGQPITRIQAGGQAIDSLARQIEGMVDRPVVNRTKLEGLYDYEVEFSPPRPLNTAPATSAPVPTGPAAPVAPIDDGPTVFDAVQQLGLKLESTRGPVVYLVIDSIEHPTED